MSAMEACLKFEVIKFLESKKKKEYMTNVNNRIIEL